MTTPELIDRLFEARDTAHAFHHATNKFAEHSALGAFYEGITDILDEFAECYYGKYGRKNRFIKIVVQAYSDKASEFYFKALQDVLMNGRPEEIAKDTELNNILDEALALVDKTLYLLTMM